MSDHLIAEASASSAPALHGEFFERAQRGPLVAGARIRRSERRQDGSNFS